MIDKISVLENNKQKKAPSIKGKGGGYGPTYVGAGVVGYGVVLGCFDGAKGYLGTKSLGGFLITFLTQKSNRG